MIRVYCAQPSHHLSSSKGFVSQDHKLSIANDSFVVPETTVQLLMGKKDSEFFMWAFILQLANQNRSLEFSFSLSPAVFVSVLSQGLHSVPREKTLNYHSLVSRHKIGPNFTFARRAQCTVEVGWIYHNRNVQRQLWILKHGCELISLWNLGVTWEFPSSDRHYSSLSLPWLRHSCQSWNNHQNLSFANSWSEGVAESFIMDYLTLL